MPKPPGSLTCKFVTQRALHSAPSPPVQITTLLNKLRVATESTPGHFSSVGLYVDAGSRYETPSTSGVSHFIDRMAFKVRCLPLPEVHMLTLACISLRPRGLV